MLRINESETQEEFAPACRQGEGVAAKTLGRATCREASRRRIHPAGTLGEVAANLIRALAEGREVVLQKCGARNAEQSTRSRIGRLDSTTGR